MVDVRVNGLMAKKQVFVGGPIQYALGSNGFDHSLRATLTNLLRLLESQGFDVLSAHRAETWGSSDSKDFPPEVVAVRDRTWMELADAYVCVLPLRSDGSLMMSGGTHIELGWASAMQVPTLIIWHADSPEKYSHLVRGLNAVANVRYLPVASIDDSLEVVDHLIHLLQAQEDDGRASRLPGRRNGAEHPVDWRRSSDASQNASA